MDGKGTKAAQGEILHFRALGHPVVRAGTLEHPLGAERRHQLLAYLAVREGWVSRAELASLFWDAHSPEDARRNLRRLLHDIRRMPWLTGLEGHGDCLRWRVATDRAAFAAACARQDWEAAARIGAGTLLDGVEPGATEPFLEWLRFERERHARQWRDSVARRRGELSNDPQARVALSLEALRHDAHDEAAVADLVRTLTDLGRGDEARSIQEEFVRRLKDDLGIEPVEEVRPPAPAPQVPQPPQAPQPAASHPDLVGRRLEMAQLLALLRRDDCRRLTIHGPGGVGKTTLARSALAALRDDFPGGAIWITHRDTAESLAKRIGERRVLVVADDCDQSPETIAAADLLLERCPQAKILQTSRTRLGCAREWVLPLVGLPVPDADETEWEVVRTFDSVRLFETRALQTHPAFDAKRHAADIVTLVREVEGLPLAIEMAAASVRLLPLAEILRDLSRIVDLQAPRGGKRSLRASFEHSWNRLDREERRTLARLAAFAGRFSMAAASQVAGARLAVIAALADKSLVSCAGDGTFSLQPLVRLLAMEQSGFEPTPA